MGQTLDNGAHFGNYVVTRLLGKGGMGEVYLMEDAVAREFYAVKILATGEISRIEDKTTKPAHPTNLDERELRFIHEAESAMNIRHPNIVSVFDAGKDPDTGLCYMTMEYMPRGSLRDIIAKTGPLGIDQVCAIAADIAAALAIIDASGLVHRDVKPANILIAADGTAKLTDLGISRFTANDFNANVTEAGDVVGTPAYMAPEQMLDSRTVDCRADIYSLGCVMYEMLAGHRFNEGENPMTTLAKALENMPPPDIRRERRDCPPPLAALVFSMMQPDFSQRPVDARTVLTLLAHPERIRTGGNAAEPVPWYSDRATLYALVAIVFSLEALVVAIATVLKRLG